MTIPLIAGICIFMFGGFCGILAMALANMAGRAE